MGGREAGNKHGGAKAEIRRARLAAALRANLEKRKAQARARGAAKAIGGQQTGGAKPSRG
jgi:hypothetical protein